MARFCSDADETETGTPCACGRRCAESDYQGNPVPCPRAFCVTDEDYIGRAIINLPENYVRLWMLLPRSDQAGERVSGSRDAPIPLAADVQAFLREIAAVTCSWEDHVRAVVRLAAYPDGHRRDAVAVWDACRTLRAHLATLLSLEPEDKGRFVSPARLAEASPDARIYFDRAGDAFEYRPMGGADAGLEFLALAGRARGMLGLNRARRRVTEVACDGCDALTLVQHEARDGGWEELIRCTACPQSYSGQQFTLISGRIYQAQIAVLEAEHARKFPVAA